MSKAIVIPGGGRELGRIKEEISLSPEKKDSIGLLSRLLRLDPLGKKTSAPSSPTTTEPPTIYYGVYIPCEIKKGPDEEAIHVYKNKSEALELVKRYKSSRFKAFRSHQDAVSFALRGAEPVDTTDGNDNSFGKLRLVFSSSIPQCLETKVFNQCVLPVMTYGAETWTLTIGLVYLFKVAQRAMERAMLGVSLKALIGEKPYPFKAPSPQDMVALRKVIEKGLAATVRDRVWDNPRFLVSSGNTPAIMQEGSRYNALHIAAKSMNAELCNLVLTTVGNPAFVQRLYGSDTDSEACEEFAGILVDRYLNTPDKAMNETPLHFAAKYGAAEAVDVLTSFRQCNKNAVNKYGEQAKDVICKRADNATGETAKRISSLLRERFYVPVLHSEDGSAVPTIGRPFTPSLPPEINQDPLSPRYEILAFAGPMESRAADVFRRKWKTPPRAPLAATRGSFRLTEMSKGFERVGRNLAEEMQVGWKEYWPFLDTFTDLRSTEGLKLLEDFLKTKYECACSFAFSETCAQTYNTVDELSLSKISMNISQNSQELMSPITELCVAMKTCKITDRPVHWSKTDPVRQRMCRQPSVKVVNGDASPPMNHTVSQLLCIERTCQVFAKRIADAITFSKSLKSEAKHLQHTIVTYMEDDRFHKIDFSLIHSRLAQLVVYKLKQQTTDLDDINNLIEFLMKLRCPDDDCFSSDDERKSFRNDDDRRSRGKKMTHVIDRHVKCLASFICEELSEESAKGPAVSDAQCAIIWKGASKCRCDWKIDVFERSSKNASFRKNRSILSTSPKNESFIKRLNFDYDIGDGAQHNRSEKSISLNSPAGDSSATVFTIDTKNCQVLEAEISEDESIASCESEDDFKTASEHSESDEEMQDANDRAVAEPFIYGEEPSKMDRLVFDAIADTQICATQCPNIYRWRHTVSLYPPEERERWVPASAQVDAPASPCASWNLSLLQTPRAVHVRRGLASPDARCSTPNKHVPSDDRNVPLQVSNWLRVTGPNSPRSSFASKSMNHNVSLGY